MLKAYVDLMSQPSRALYIFLKISKIPHEIVPVALRKGEHLEEKYAAVNPFQQVPAIDDNGFCLNESVAILKYLCDKYQVADSFYPKDLEKRAKIDAFTHWQHLNLRFGGSTIFRSLIIDPAITSKPVDEKRLDVGLRSLKASLDRMESIFLSSTPYIYSERLTIADLLGVCELMQPKFGVGVDVESRWPKVTSWTQRVRESVGAELFDEAHIHIKKLGDRFKASGAPMPKL